VFEAPGFYFIGVTVTNSRFSDLAYRDFRAVDNGPELGTEGKAGDWSWEEVYRLNGFQEVAGSNPAAPTWNTVGPPHRRAASRSSFSGNVLRLVFRCTHRIQPSS